MATLLLKQLKFPRTLYRLLFSTNFTYCPHPSRLITIQRQLQKTKIFYSTAAFKQVSSDDYKTETMENVNRKTSPQRTIQGIDDALAKIDYFVQHTNRVLSTNVITALSLSKEKGKELFTAAHGLYLLRACKYICDIPPRERVQLVNEIWNRFQELGIKFDVKHYNALLEVHIKNEFDFNPAEILASMEDRNLEPNEVTYLHLMKKYAKDGNLSGTSQILEHMKEQGLSANEDIFNCLIECHINNGDLSGALDILDAMRSSELIPNENTYTILACGYAGKGEKNKMISWLKDEAEKGNCIISAEKYLQVIATLANAGYSQYIDDVLSMINNIYGHQQECINTAFDLMHKDLTDIAYKIIIASSTLTSYPGIKIFIKQLIHAEKPTPQILQFCNDIIRRGFNFNFGYAVEMALDNGNIDYVLGFLDFLVQNGYSVRASSFSKIFARFPKSSWKILKKMQECGVLANFTMYIDYVFPALGIPEPDDVISGINDTNQSFQTAIDALFLYYMNMDEVNYAQKLIECAAPFVDNRLDFRRFLNLHNPKKSSILRERYMKVLQYILETVEPGENSYVTQGKRLAELILVKPHIFDDLLKFMKRNKDVLHINEKALDVCQYYIRQHDPPKLFFFAKLRSRNYSVKMDMTFEEEEEKVKLLEKQRLSCKPFLMDRFMYHASETKDIERINKLKSIYENHGFTYPPSVLEQFISLFCDIGDLPKLQEHIIKLRNECPSYKLDPIRTLDCASMLIQYMKYEEAVEVLKMHLTKPFIHTTKSDLVESIKTTLNAACDSGNIELFKNVQSLLFPLSELFDSKKLFLEPLVYVYIDRNDLLSAYDEYVKCLKNYHIPICINKLLRRLIFDDDKLILQKVVDITSVYAGKSFTSFELALAFIQTSHTQEAAKVIQNLGSEADGKMLEHMFEKLHLKNKFLEMEKLLEIIKPLTHIDRKKLYHYLFKALVDRNDYRRAINVFSRLENEVFELENNTIQLLVNLLKENNQPLPDFLLEVSSDESSATPLDTELFKQYTETFTDCLYKGDIESALSEIMKLKKGYIRSLSFQNMTDFIELCYNNNRLKDLSSNVYVMPYIIDNDKNILEPLFVKYSSLGNVEALTTIASAFPDYSLKNANFNKHFCKAFISSGRHADLISELEKHYEKRNGVFSFTAFEELLRFPELGDRLYCLALKYFKIQFPQPIAIIWAHHFLKREMEKANEIFKNYPFPLEKVDRKILKYIREGTDESISLAKEYIKFINQIPVKQPIKERAYGALLDVLVLKGDYDEASALVVESQGLNLQLDKYHKSTLITLGNALEKDHKSIPFIKSSENVIPDRELNTSLYS